MAEIVRVGIVDSGVRPDQPVRAGRAFYLSGDRVETGAAQADRLGHGSRLLEVILGQAPEAKVWSAQVFFERLVTTPVQFTAALLWLAEQRVQVVNLSLGLRQDHPMLQSACDLALAQGIIICAATPARGDPVWPAAYPGVLRVTGDARCRADQFSWLGSRYADLGACVRTADAALAGASVGCAYLSGHIAGYLARHGDPSVTLDWLRRRAAFTGPEHRRA